MAETLSTAPSSEEAAAPDGCLGAASSCFRGKQMVGETAARHRHQASTRAPKGGTRKICLGYGTAQQHTCSKTFLRIDLPPLSHLPSLSLRTSSPAPPALGRSCMAKDALCKQGHCLHGLSPNCPFHTTRTQEMSCLPFCLPAASRWSCQCHTALVCHPWCS